MRARYSAFAVRDAAYLLETWHPSTRPDRLRLDPTQQWSRLDVLTTSAGGLFDSEGTVEFRATYRVGRRAAVLHETSRFVRADGRWSYLGPLPQP